MVEKGVEKGGRTKKKKKSNMPELYWTLFFLLRTASSNSKKIRIQWLVKEPLTAWKRRSTAKAYFITLLIRVDTHMHTCYCCYFCSPALHYTSSSCRAVQHLEACHIHIYSFKVQTSTLSIVLQTYYLRKNAKVHAAKGQVRASTQAAMLISISKMLFHQTKDPMFHSYHLKNR